MRGQVDSEVIREARREGRRERERERERERVRTAAAPSYMLDFSPLSLLPHALPTLRLLYVSAATVLGEDQEKVPVQVHIARALRSLAYDGEPRLCNEKAYDVR